jgi:hypothetical protein
MALGGSEAASTLRPALQSILRLAAESPSHYNFLFNTINWFGAPYRDHLDILEKGLRIFRGRGKEAERVAYNLLADGMLVDPKAAECLLRLTATGCDRRLLC